MIKIRIKNADHEIDVQFPISENKLYAKLAEIHAIEGKDAPQSAFVTEVYWPEELSMLKDRFANLDELNYLARRMESFDYHEYDQFLIGITKLENPTEKDLINLTFNLDHFTLCKDVSNYGKIGREYVMNTEGAVPAHDEDDPKYAAIGKDLIDRGLAQITEKGLLIYNPCDELTEVYDGQTFPEYYYENSLASAEVSYNGRTELLLLPGEEIAIKKALTRLGAPSDSDCDIKFCLSQGEDDAWEERIEGIIRSEGLYEANKMLRSLDTGDMDWGKLTAAVELTDVKTAANIAVIAQHLGEFGFLPDAKSESDVGHFLVDNVDEYAMNIEMEEYFDFSGFGEYFAEEHDGQFVNGGFVYFDSDRSLDEFLEELESEDEGMDIGGFRSGLEAVGEFECIGHCEIDKRTNMAYCAIYDTEGEYYCDDARKINPDEMPDFDLLCAGFPCQSFSVAGKRLGFEDTRGTLFFEVARLLAAKRPAFFLLENVPGLLSHDGGKTLETIYATLIEMGYHFEWCVHNSRYFGVPQQRRRLYIVGYLDPRCAGQIFPLSGGNAAHLRQLIGGAQGQRVYDPNGVACTQAATSGGWGGKTGLYFIDMNADPIVTDVARCITARQDSGVSKHRGEHSAVLIEDAPRAILTPDREKVRQQGRRIKEPDEPMFTITAQDRHGILHRGRIRKLMPIECWRLQGYADEQFNKAAALGLKDGLLYKMAGNSVSVPVISAIGQKIKAANEKYEIVR